ncbi:MAG: MFS transporter, partial [Anaerolineae bacterium]
MSNSPEKEIITRRAFGVVFIVALGGFLFGYQTGVISGALLFLTQQFSLSAIQQGSAVSIILVGACFGGLFAGAFVDQLGRKKATAINALVFLAGTFMTAYAETFALFLCGRFVTGLAVGITTLTTPLYLAEIAPIHRRGAFVSLNQLAITVGVLVSYGACFLLARSQNWRLMIGWGALPAIVQLFAALFLFETPSWLLSQGKREEARKV